MDGGMDLENSKVPLVIRMRVNINPINIMDVASIVGRMAGSMRENSVNMSAMAKGPMNGPMVTRIR
jgi:hypothetical protein